MIIHRSALKLVEVAETDGIRWQLAGVHVRRVEGTGRVEACATNGKLMAVVRHDEPDGGELPGELEPGDEGGGTTLPSKFVKKLAKLFRWGSSASKPILDYFRLRREDGKLRTEVVDDDLDVHGLRGREIEGKFPDYPKLFENRRTHMTIQVDPWRLLDAAKLAVALASEHGQSRKTDGQVDLVIPEPDRDGRVTKPLSLELAKRGSSWEVYVMPVVMVK